MAGKVTSLEGKVPKAQPQLQVVSLDGASALLFGPRAERYNPDALAARKGGLGIYKKMLQDEQVKAVMKFRRDSIIGRGHEFVFEDTALPDEEQKRRVQVMSETTRRMNGSFADAIVGVLTGMAYGFSVSEFVTQTIKVAGSPYIGLADILTRDPESFKFYTDDYGTLTRLTQLVNAREVELDPDRFVHYVQNPEVDPYYGESELRAAYRPWFMKDLDIKLWAAYKERVAGGFLAVELGSSGITPGSTDYQVLENALRNMRSTMGIMLPNGVTAEMHMPGANDVFEKALTVHDLAIAKSLLVPNLLGMSQTGQTGSFSQSQTQLETYFMTLATDTQRLEQCLNDQLFRVLALQNWDDGEFPRFRFKKASAEHVKWVVDSVVALSGAGGLILTPKDEAHLRQLLDLAPRDESDDALAKVKQDLVPIQEDPNKLAAIAAKAQGPGNKGAAFSDAAMGSNVRSGMTCGHEGCQGLASFAGFAKDGDWRVMCPEHWREVLPKQFTEEPKKVPTKMSLDRAMERVDFAVIAQRALGIEEDVADKIAMTAAKVVAHQLTDERLAALLGTDVEQIGQVRIEDAGIGKLKAAFKDGLTRAWALGLNQAMVETSKARKTTFSKADRQAHFAALRENAADWFESNAFRMAGNFTDGMRAIIQQELLSAVKTGKRQEEVAAQIFIRLINKGFVTLKAVLENEHRENVLEAVREAFAEAAGTENVAAYLNTLVRTNTFEALNEARYAEFTDPSVSDFVLALRYSAILDDRTTNICQELDGHVHATGSKVWEKYRPPNHYNCRSVMFAVTALDGWDGQESPEPTVEPQEGFK